MNSGIIINSLGIGAILFLVLLIVWFIAVYMKRRVGPEQFRSGAVSLKAACWEEKRQQPRVSVSWMATLDAGHESTAAQVKDVSLVGAFVVCENPLPLKSRLLITLKPSAREPLALTAEVIWSNGNVPDDKIINRGMGIRFIANDESTRNRLNQLIIACFEE